MTYEILLSQILSVWFNFRINEPFLLCHVLDFCLLDIEAGKLDRFKKSIYCHI